MAKYVELEDILKALDQCDYEVEDYPSRMGDGGWIRAAKKQTDGLYSVIRFYYITGRLE